VGKALIEKNKQRKHRQDPIEEGSQVFFTGFTKNKKTGPTYYTCKGVIIESPSSFNKAPHKVRITAVALSRLDKGGSPEDGKTLLGKEIYLPIEKLNTELQSWLAPDLWWF